VGVASYLVVLMNCVPWGVQTCDCDRVSVVCWKRGKEGEVWCSNTSAEESVCVFQGWSYISVVLI
jgi:hypothetical protein